MPGVSDLFHRHVDLINGFNPFFKNFKIALEDIRKLGKDGHRANRIRERVKDALAYLHKVLQVERSYPSDKAILGYYPSWHPSWHYPSHVRGEPSYELKVTRCELSRIQQDYQFDLINTTAVIARVSNLFDGHVDLINGFNTFLPPDYKQQTTKVSAPQCARLLQLMPDDMLELISDFVATHTLSHVCRCLRSLLQGRHYKICQLAGGLRLLHYWTTGLLQVKGLHTLQLVGNLDGLDGMKKKRCKFGWLGFGVRVVAALKKAPQLQTLYLHLPHRNNRRFQAAIDDGRKQLWDALAALKDAPQLRILCVDFADPGSRSWDTVHLALQKQKMTNTGAKALAGLKEAPQLRASFHLSGGYISDAGTEALAGLTLALASQLHTLHLNLARNGITDTGAEALAGLKEASQLHTLHLNLTENRITEAGLWALTALKYAPQLCTLRLGFADSGITDAGCHALAAFKEAPQLRNLFLDLSLQSRCDADEITDAGAHALAGLKEAPQLHTLHLDLSHRKITDAGAQALAGFKEAPQLRNLRLDLACSRITDAGAQALAGLQGALRLHTLHLGLRSLRGRNGRHMLTDAGCHALTALKAAPQLHTLHLDLAANCIGDAGAHALAGLKGAPKLCTLHLDLDSNNIEDGGARALATLKETPRLHNLCLNLAGSDIMDAGAQAIATLMEAPQLRTLCLDLSSCGLTDAGAEAIVAKAPQVQKLELILDGNQITDAGAQALFLAQALTPQLQVSLKYRILQDLTGSWIRISDLL